MRILLLEPDGALAMDMIRYLNECRLKMEIHWLEKEEELTQMESFADYSLFVLNLSEPTNPCTMKLIRSRGGYAPLMLILEAGIDRSAFKTLYYLSYDDIMVKNFLPEEITFKIYKLCGVWNDDLFFISNHVYFDFRKSRFYNKKEEIYLGKKEALLLRILLLKAPHSVSHEEIACFVYSDEIPSEERIRSLVRQLRSKLPSPLIECIKGEGYRAIMCSSI